MADQQVVLITGTRKGIGRHLAETYAKRGFLVEGCSRGDAGWEGEHYTHANVDVADEKSVTWDEIPGSRCSQDCLEERRRAAAVRHRRGPS